MYVDKDFHIKYNNAVFPEDHDNKDRFISHTKSTYKADLERSHISTPLIPKLLPQGQVDQHFLSRRKAGKKLY